VNWPYATVDFRAETIGSHRPTSNYLPYSDNTDKADFHGNILYVGAIALNAKLSQVMVDVLVHENGPLLRV